LAALRHARPLRRARRIAEEVVGQAELAEEALERTVMR